MGFVPYRRFAIWDTRAVTPQATAITKATMKTVVMGQPDPCPVKIVLN
jgi:hypothetical protein